MLCSMPSTSYYNNFSTGGKFLLASNFTELYALALAAHSYVLLIIVYVGGEGGGVEMIAHVLSLGIIVHSYN